MVDGGVFKKAQVFDPNTMSMRDAVVPTGEAVDVDRTVEAGAADAGSHDAIVGDEPQLKRKKFRRRKKQAES